jgi:hypothetical protein
MVVYRIEDGSEVVVCEEGKKLTSPGRGWDRMRISRSGDGVCGEGGIVR